MSYNSPNDTTSGCLDSTMLSVIENNEPERLRLYRSVVQETLREIFSTINVEEFSKEFKDHSISKTFPDSISSIYTMVTQNIHKKVGDIIEKQIKEDSLEEKFAQLDKIIQSCSISDIPAWRPSHDVQDNLRSQIMEEKIKLRDQLKHMLFKKEDTVTKLKFNVNCTRMQKKAIDERIADCEAKLHFLNS